MNDGEVVTRTKVDRTIPPPNNPFSDGTWANGICLDDEGTVCNTKGLPVLFSLGALLADDWEIVDE